MTPRTSNKSILLPGSNASSQKATFFTHCGVQTHIYLIQGTNLANLQAPIKSQILWSHTSLCDVNLQKRFQFYKIHCRGRVSLHMCTLERDFVLHLFGLVRGRPIGLKTLRDTTNLGPAKGWNFVASFPNCCHLIFFTKFRSWDQAAVGFAPASDEISDCP